MRFEMLSLFDFLSDTSRTEPVEDLKIARWRTDLWSVKHSIGLAHLCNGFRIKRLILRQDDWDSHIETGYHKDLLRHAVTADFPFLRYLHTFEVEYSEIQSNLDSRFINQSRVVKVICHMRDELEKDELFEACDFFLRSFDGSNLGLREIRFRYPWDQALSDFKVESGGILPLTPRLSKVLVILGRNQKAFRKCQNATLVILGLKRRRSLLKHSDLIPLLASMVWETRGTKDWIHIDPL